MEVSCIFDTFLCNLFAFLVGRSPYSTDELKIFRKHNNKLNQCGEFSFPLNINGWQKYIDHFKSSVCVIDYIDKFDSNNLNETDFTELLNISLNWETFSIKCIKVQDKKVHVFINRNTAYKKLVSMILTQKDNYGVCNLHIKPILIKIEDKEENFIDLTSLRLSLLKDVTENILKKCGCYVLQESEECAGSEVIYLSNKSESKCVDKKVVCGVVICNKFGKKNTDVTVEALYSSRTVDMRLMAQHKYGLRTTSEAGWEDFFKHLGAAAVTIDLLRVKPSRVVIINENTSATSCSKGASFILYNCARLAAIFKQFDQKVLSGVYPPLPHVEQVNFELLNQPEEWEILYVYVMQYPSVVKSCISDISNCRLNTHNLCVFLDSLCSAFSVYYRRVRILMEPRLHLFAVLHARLHLLFCIQQVLHNALALLNILPIKQM